MNQTNSSDSDENQIEMKFVREGIEIGIDELTKEELTYHYDQLLEILKLKYEEEKMNSISTIRRHNPFIPRKIGVTDL